MFDGVLIYYTTHPLLLFNVMLHVKNDVWNLGGHGPFISLS